MRRIDQHEQGSARGGGLYPCAPTATAELAPASAARPERSFPDNDIRSIVLLRGPHI